MSRVWTAICLLGAFGFWFNEEWALGMLILLLGNMLELNQKIDNLEKAIDRLQAPSEPP